MVAFQSIDRVLAIALTCLSIVEALLGYSLRTSLAVLDALLNCAIVGALDVNHLLVHKVKLSHQLLLFPFKPHHFVIFFVGFNYLNRLLMC